MRQNSLQHTVNEMSSQLTASLLHSYLYTNTIGSAANYQRVTVDMARNRDQGPRGGAEHLARIHGTEEDKVNCPFYFKIGACRHGERCSRQHHRPPFSQTILIQHMWQNPMCIITAGGGDLNGLDKVQFQDDFNEFYDEIFEEFKNYGKLEDVQVCENLGDHMVYK